MFGKPATGLFGNTGNTSFGSNTFGTASNTGGFGGGATFGSTPFGGTSQATGMFGGANTMGGGGGGGGGMFGGGASTFGTSVANTSFNFGGGALQTSQQNSSLFGATATSGPITNSLFGGQPTQQSTGFGQAPAMGGMSLFGGATNTNAGGFLGGLGAQQSGTTIKYVPLSGTDTVVKGGNNTTINTKLHCITAMKEYENKSLEELRLEDYQANRKSGPTIGSNIGGGVFLNNQQPQSQSTGFGMFGNQPKSAFSGFGTSTAASTSLFGNSLSQAKPLFGGGATTTTTASTGFGGLSSGSLFGAQSKPGGFFGSTTTTTTQSSLGFFGNTQQPQASNAFGLGTQNTNTGGLFGTKPIGFGQTTTTSSFTFGTSQANQSGIGGGAFGGGSLFNKPAASAAPGFGIPTQNTSLGFGGFGATSMGSTPGFGAIGAANPTGGLFSNQQKPAGSLFGNNTSTGFGQGVGLGNNTLNTGGLGTTNTMGSLNTGLFGATNTSLLGGQLQMQPQQQQNVELLMQLEQQKQIQQHITALNSSPYGDNPLFKNLHADQVRQNELLRPTNPIAQQTLLSNQMRYKTSQDKPTLKKVPLPNRSEKSLLFDCLDEVDNMTNLNETFVPRKNYKFLDVKSIVQQQQSFNSLKESLSQSHVDSPLPISPANGITEVDRKLPVVGGLKNGDIERMNMSSVKVRSRNDMEESQYDRNFLNNTMDELFPRGPQGQETETVKDSPAVTGPPKPSHPAGVVSTRPDYFTLPSLDEMAKLTNENGACIVTDLVIGREGYGNVFFPGETDVTNMNLDELVHFRRKEIEIYPDSNKKQPQGEGLNKKAQVTLDQVYPVDKATKEPITDYDRLLNMGFIEKLEKRCIAMEAKFVEYRPETGSYVFIVNHFSKYGILDDSDDEEVVAGKTGAEVAGSLQKPPSMPATTNIPKQQPTTPAQQTRHARFIGDADDDNDASTQQVDERAIKKVKGTPHPKMSLTDREMMMEEEDGKYFNKETSYTSSAKMSFYDDVERDYKKEESDDDDMMDQSKSPTFEALRNVSARRVQLQKASFFEGFMDEDGDDDDVYMKKNVALDKENIFKNASFSSKKFLGFQPMFANDSSILAPSATNRSIFADSMKSTPTPQSVFSTKLLKSSLITPTTSSIVTTHAATPFKSTHPILPSRMTDEDRMSLEKRFKVIVTARKKANVPFEESLMANKQKFLMDLGLVQGASTRVGWGAFYDEEHPGWSLAHVGRAMCHEEQDDQNMAKNVNLSLTKKQTRLEDDETSSSSLSVKLERVIPPSSFEGRFAVKDLIQECLKSELDHCRVECSPMDLGSDDDDMHPSSMECPYFSYTKDPQSLLAEVTQKLEKVADQSGWSHSMSSVWRLCTSLWGDLGVDVRAGDYYYESLRKEAITKWLIEEAQERIKEEVKNENNMDGHKTFIHLTGFQVKEAVEASMKVKDFHLALVLSQASSPDDVRLMLRKQLEIWSDSKSDQFISESRLAIFALLAGVLVLKTSKESINCCKSLDWKRCFGLHLWFACPSTCTISDALNEYEMSYDGSSPLGRYSSAPNPPYMERWGLGEGVGIKDVTFHLLKLYGNKSYPLQSILDPAAFSENDLDYSCSWHLMKLLGSLGYQHLTNFHLSSICHNYASQLEALGLWHWAAFILMHIPLPISRTDAVKKLITRNVVLVEREDDDDAGDDDEEEEEDDLLNDKERFLVEKLLIPVEWIHEAKAIRANSEGRDEVRSIHLIRAHQYALYHQLIVNKLAPSAVAHGDHDSLKKWFKRLEEAILQTTEVGMFEDGGGVYMKYLRVLEIVDWMDAVVDDDLNNREDESLTELEHLLSILTVKIKYLPSATPIDRYAQHLMSQSLLKASVKLLSNDKGTYEANEGYTLQLRDTLCNLPMSEELVDETHSKLSHELLRNTIIRSIKMVC